MRLNYPNLLTDVKNLHQSNCIEACIYREVKDKYNCAFPLTLFAFHDLKKCDIQNRNFHSFRQEFSVGCLMECPLESCYSEKWTSYVISEINGGPTVFYVSLRDFTSLNITQIPKTDSFTFINNTGGGLGLFMGISFQLWLSS